MTQNEDRQFLRKSHGEEENAKHQKMRAVRNGPEGERECDN
jgi:hypothetical protein